LFLISESIPSVMLGASIGIGNHVSDQLRNRRMAAGIDEQLLFSRVLTVDEIATVMNFTKPKGK
jgi:hypothetical protein